MGDIRKIFSFAFLIIAFSIAYYLVFYIPERESKRQELELQKISSEREYKNQQADRKEKQLDDCLTQSHKDYMENWNLACTSQGLKEECTLNSNLADSRNKDYQTDQELCIKKYK